jgi:spore coat polysaccharide biosynthesis protein SpsF
MRIIGLIQAREGSARFPGKVLEKIGDKSILAHCFERSKQLPLDDVIVVTGPERLNRRIDRECRDIGAPCLCYNDFPENNVMLRFLYAGLLYEADYILRICADAPFFDCTLSVNMIQALKTKNCHDVIEHQSLYDYYTYYEKDKDIPCIAYIPKGHFKELVSMEVLFRAYKQTLPADREHVTPYIWKNPDKYKIKRIEITKDEIELLPKCDINEPSDLKEIRRLYDKGIIK